MESQRKFNRPHVDMKVNFPAITLFIPYALCHDWNGSQLSALDFPQIVQKDLISYSDEIPFSTRAYWMRRATSALADAGLPCTFTAFATVIVNHTDAQGLGTLICSGVNQNRQTGNPVLHGEISAINNCTAILTDPQGQYKLTPAQAQSAFSSLSLYTNAESCPMCASAIRWAGFREYIFGTSIASLIEKGWGQINIASDEVFQRSSDLPNPTSLIGNVLTNETDPYFFWQFDPEAPCPPSCHRTPSGKSCTAA